MHSNSHLGISLAAMTHVAAAVPNLTYALDTHWPWKTEDVIVDAVHLQRRRARGADRPGLGVELDRDALGAAARAVPRVRRPRPQRHPLHAVAASLLRRDAAPLVSVTGYAYPWDYLDDDGAAARAASLGIDVVALAASYHATRVATPLHPTRRVTEIPTPPRTSPFATRSGAGNDCDHAAPAAWIGPDAFERRARSPRRAKDSLSTGGSSSPTTTTSRLQSRTPGSKRLRRVVLLRPVPTPRRRARLLPHAGPRGLRVGGLRGVVLEACGPMGLDHGGDPRQGGDGAAGTRSNVNFCPSASVGACEGALRGRRRSRRSVAHDP